MNELACRVRDILRNTRNRHLFLIDAALLQIIPGVCLAVRLEGEWIEPYAPTLFIYTVVGLVVRLFLFIPFRLYRRYWFYATVDELMHLTVSIVTATALAAIPFYVTGGYAFAGTPLPRSIPVMDAFLSLTLLGGIRFCMRLANRYSQPRPQADAKRVLIVGAGHAGQIVARDIQANTGLSMRVVGFLDDDPAKRGTQMGRNKVLGALADLPSVVSSHRVAEVIIAMPTAGGAVVRKVVDLAEQVRVPVRTVPLVHEIIKGKVTVQQLRNVQVEDLLRREEIRTDTDAVTQLVSGRRVLVTGGGGSIGSELCRQILDRGPAELILLGHGENSVFEIENQLRALAMRHATNRPKITAVIADIRFSDRVTQVMRNCRPEIIFHAAAHKHVPLMEHNPGEAITNNVFGTRNLLRAAEECDVQRFVMISTDKAVNPTSIMGASKRVAELLVLRTARKTGRPFVAVRFGNVLGSRGSVVHTFRRQIENGGPVTVSHPEMRRYFMTTPEAVQLVLQASVLGRGGEIFVLDMGQPVYIKDLARDMIELSGLEVDRDVAIKFTGVRPGEKLFEELYIPGEDFTPTRHEKILIASNASSFVPAGLDQSLRVFEEAASSGDNRAVVQTLVNLLPEYQPDPAHGVERTASPAETFPVAAG